MAPVTWTYAAFHECTPMITDAAGKQMRVVVPNRQMSVSGPDEPATGCWLRNCIHESFSPSPRPRGFGAPGLKDIDLSHDRAETIPHLSRILPLEVIDWIGHKESP